MTAAALAILPLMPGYVNYITSRGPGEVEAPPFIITFEFLRSLFGLLGAGPDWTFWLFAAMFVVGVIAAIAQRNRIAVLLVLWLVLPFIVLWAAAPRHIFIPRYFLFLQPVYLLLVGHGLIVVTSAVAGCWRWVSGSSHSGSTRLREVLQVLTVGGVIAVTLVPTTAGYFVEKRNDWSSVCAYLKPRLKPGDAVTGDAYVVGLMMWCLRSHTGALVVDPVVDSPAQLALRGVNIWYVHIDPEARMDWVVQHAIPVAKKDWARAGLADFNAFPFPQAEHPTTLYYYSPTEAPADVRFRQVRGSGGTPDYTQVVPGQRYGVRLGLKALRPRMLRVTFFDLKGRDLEVFVNGRSLLNIEAGKSGGQWVPVDIALPADLPDVVLVEFRNPGRETSAVSEAQLVYVSVSH
jgi:hypothetical protein